MKRIEAIMAKAHTGGLGHGKIFVFPVAEVIGSRTGEIGESTV